MAETQQASEASEVDATELQFPKGLVGMAGKSKTGVVSECKAGLVTRAGDRCEADKTGVADTSEDGNIKSSEVHCDHCDTRIHGSYIRCGECVGVGVCVRCFSRGVEFGSHRSNHQYSVAEGMEGVVEAGWGAGEELSLLDALAGCGVGNWQEVSHRLPGRTPEQCRIHYTRCYLHPSHPSLAAVLGRPPEPPLSPTEPVEYQGGGDDPPRPLPGSAAARDLAGYNPARGDFETEPETEAESVVSDIDPGLFQCDPAGSLGVALQVALLDLYRHRLGDRHRRKQIVREHGLVAGAKAGQSLSRHRQYLPRALADVLPRILPLLPAMDLDLLLEGLKYESELKRQINDLMEWRGAGLSRHRSVLTYETLRRRREAGRKERRSLVVAQGGVEWDQWSVLPRAINHPSPAASGNHRRISQPLNISGKPGYDTLTEAERLLCSELRLLPEDFTRFKAFFMDECRRSGGLRLAQARTLIKIDVNKTRKIYDHLLEQGLIHIPHKR